MNTYDYDDYDEDEYWDDDHLGALDEQLARQEILYSYQHSMIGKSFNQFISLSTLLYSYLSYLWNLKAVN